MLALNCQLKLSLIALLLSSTSLVAKLRNNSNQFTNILRINHDKKGKSAFGQPSPFRISDKTMACFRAISELIKLLLLPFFIGMFHYLLYLYWFPKSTKIMLRLLSMILLFNSTLTIHIVNV